MLFIQVPALLRWWPVKIVNGHCSYNRVHFSEFPHSSLFHYGQELSYRFFCSGMCEKLTGFLRIYKKTEFESKWFHLVTDPHEAFFYVELVNIYFQILKRERDNMCDLYKIICFEKWREQMCNIWFTLEISIRFVVRWSTPPYWNFEYHMSKKRSLL